jgi:hypothetical protein
MCHEEVSPCYDSLTFDQSLEATLNLSKYRAGLMPEHKIWNYLKRITNKDYPKPFIVQYSMAIISIREEKVKENELEAKLNKNAQDTSN